MKIRFGFILAAVAGLIARPAQAHIGSPAVVFDGLAGPYSVRVIILPPPVVPGRAEIDVRMLKDEIEPVKVTVLPVSSRAGLTGAPPPDEATIVPGEPSLRHGELWLMSPGSYSVHVTVEGARGHGTVIVPVVAEATQRLAMPTGLGIILWVLGGLLFAGAATLAGTGMRECVLPPEAALSASQRRRGYFAIGAAAVVLAVCLDGGWRWWRDVDRNFRNNEIYHPLPMAATVLGSGDSRVLSLSIERAGGNSRGTLRLIPDHGKLMHLFLIREPQLDAMAHLHPVRSGPHSFDVVLPPLPDGRYTAYADITSESGLSVTLTTVVNLDSGSGVPQIAAVPARDPDDSWHVENSASNPASGPHLVLTDGSGLRAGKDLALDFKAVDGTGQPIAIQPYMGMLGHAAVRRSDGTVFAHIHPVGTISMAAQDFFIAQAARETGTAAPMDHSQHLRQAGAANAVSFPYLFPRAGSYRIWVQTKVAGEVITGVFDVNVASLRD